MDPEMEMYVRDENKPDPESDIVLITTGERSPYRSQRSPYRSQRSSSRRHGYGDSSSVASSRRSRGTMGRSGRTDGSGVDENSRYYPTSDPDYYRSVPSIGGGRDALGHSDDVLSRYSSASGGGLSFRTEMPEYC